MRLRFILATPVLLLSMAGWSAEPVASAPKLVRIHVEAPEYPPTARRFNVSGTVTAKMRVEADGHVSKTEVVLSPADILSEAVVAATAKWRYEPIAQPYDGVVQIPFQLTGGDDSYAFGTDVRPFAAPLPTAAAELGVELTEGWSHVRLIIDEAGAVIGKLVLKSSGPEFDASCQAILAALKFSPASQGDLGTRKKATVNLFFIHVVPGGEIRIAHYSGV